MVRRTMPAKPPRLRRRNLLIVCLCAVALCSFAAMARAQSVGSTAHTATEMEAILFVQSLHTKDGQDGIHLVWVPQPILRLCLGKTADRCATIDYCIRTTNRDVSMCRNLGMPLSSLPSYPPGMVPRRQLSVTFFRLTPDY